MISLEDILLLHRKSIEDYGGSLGVRDLGLLELLLHDLFRLLAELIYILLFMKKLLLWGKVLSSIILFLMAISELVCWQWQGSYWSMAFSSLRIRNPFMNSLLLFQQVI